MCGPQCDCRGRGIKQRRTEAAHRHGAIPLLAVKKKLAGKRQVRQARPRFLSPPAFVLHLVAILLRLQVRVVNFPPICWSAARHLTKTLP